MGHVAAVTRVASADGQFWDIQDTSPWAQDSGGIATGGRAYPFNGFGYLKMQVSAPGGRPAHPNRYLRGFGLSFDGVERFDSITPLLQDGIVVARALTAPRDTTYLRYFDTFTNTTGAVRVVQVAWGGAAGAYADGGIVAVATTSSGDRRIDPSDAFVAVMQNARGVADPMLGPSGHGPSAHVLGSKPWRAHRRGRHVLRPVQRPLTRASILRTSATSSRSGCSLARRPRSSRSSSRD